MEKKVPPPMPSLCSPRWKPTTLQPSGLPPLRFGPEAVLPEAPLPPPWRVEVAEAARALLARVRHEGVVQRVR